MNSKFFKTSGFATPDKKSEYVTHAFIMIEPRYSYNEIEYSPIAATDKKQRVAASKKHIVKRIRRSFS